MYWNTDIEQIKKARQAIQNEIGKPKVRTVYPDRVYSPSEIFVSIREGIKSLTQ